MARGARRRTDCKRATRKKALARIQVKRKDNRTGHRTQPNKKIKNKKRIMNSKAWRNRNRDRDRDKTRRRSDAQRRCTCARLSFVF